MTSILLVDDHPLFCEGFGHIARATRPQWTIRFAASADEAIRELTSSLVHLVIIDVGLPVEDGFVLLEKIKKLSAATPQILMSGRDDAAVLMRARAVGARAFITKNSSPDRIIQTIDAVLAGGTVVDMPCGEIPSLTERENDVLTLLGLGLGNKEIRHRLNIAERTVRAHLTEIFHKLGASSRMQAVMRARELGLVP